MTTKKQDTAETKDTAAAAQPATGDTAAATDSPVDIARMTAIRPEGGGLHERLETAELAAMTGPQELAGPLNRITVLTGALKTSLPDAIRHVTDDDLRADLESLLASL